MCIRDRPGGAAVGSGSAHHHRPDQGGDQRVQPRGARPAADVYKRQVLAALRAALGVEGGHSTITQGYGDQIAQGLAQGLENVDSGLFDWGAQALMAAVSQAIDRAFQVESTGWFGSGGATASRFAPLGEAVCKAIADGISSNNGNTQLIQEAITAVADAAFEAAVSQMASGITGSTGEVNAAVELSLIHI